MSLQAEMRKVRSIKPSDNGQEVIPTCPEMTLDYTLRNELPAMKNNASTVIMRGEIFALVGAPGHGKTSLLEGACASLLAASYNLPGVDTFGFAFNSTGKKALFCDTERPGDDCHKTYQNIYKRLGKDRQLLSDDGKKIKDLTYLVMSEVGEVDHLWVILEQHLVTDEYELVILDGILDFCLSLLDDEDAVRVLKRLRSLAVKYNCAIVVSIHPNKGTTNPAGHIGSFLYRWCRAMLFVRTTTDKNVKELTTDFDFPKLSHSSLGDFEPVYFSWDSGRGMMTTCGEPAPPMYKINYLKQSVIELRLKGHHEIPSGILRDHYGKLASVKPETAKKHISKAADDGLLIPSGNGKATKYLPSTDWDLGIGHSGTDAPYIDRGAIPDSSKTDTRYPIDTRIPDKGYPIEWDNQPEPYPQTGYPIGPKTTP